MQVSLAGRKVGHGAPVYIVAEGGVTNWGRLDLAQQQVDAAMAAGCDAIKFQAQTTEALVSKKADPYWYKRMKYKELSHDDLRKLWEYCAVRNIQCFITAHTEVDLDFLDRDLDVPFFKIGSGESQNLEFLRNVGSRGKPVVMSLGLHRREEDMRRSVEALERVGCRDIVLLHCNSIYPTPPEQCDLLGISCLQSMFEYPVGYSDHSVGWHIPLAAVALGAVMIEKHLSFDLDDKRSVDCAGSVTPQTLKSMVAQMRDVEAALRNASSARSESLGRSAQWAQQSIVAAVDVPQGACISREMVAFKRPGTGLSPARLSDIVGKRAKRAIAADELIRLDVLI